MVTFRHVTLRTSPVTFSYASEIFMPAPCKKGEGCHGLMMQHIQRVPYLVRPDNSHVCIEDVAHRTTRGNNGYAAVRAALAVHALDHDIVRAARGVAAGE